MKIILAHANEFMRDDDELDIFNYSPLYRINQIPNYVINALGLCGIHTVEDLIRADIKKLSQYPMLGKRL